MLIDLKTSFSEQQRLSTEKERNRMKEAGGTELSPADVEAMLASMGFKIDPSCSFNYYNTGNAIHYHARSIYIIDIKRKISFAHCDFGIGQEEHERREKLQKFRLWTHGWDGKRIWEL